MKRAIRVLLAVLAVTAGASLAGEPRQETSLQLTLPSDCYAVVGVPLSIYYDNIVLSEKPEQYRFQIQGDLGTAEGRRWTVTPGVREVGDHRLSVSVADARGQVLQRGKTTLHVAPATSGAGQNVRLLIVGDSLTSATVYPNEIARLLSQPGNPAWSMLGTNRPASATKGVAHEGYGGWTWERFVSHWPAKPGPNPKDRASPFLFAEDGARPVLDLPHYFTSSCDGKQPDVVTFLLGINDCFSADPDSPAAIDARITAMFADADNLIAAFRAAAPRADLGICLTTPPNARESGFEANYHGRYHRWGWKCIQHRLVQRELEHFGGREGERIFVVPTELNLDPLEGYPDNNGVHPNPTGYREVGATIFAWLKWRLNDPERARRTP